VREEERAVRVNELPQDAAIKVERFDHAPLSVLDRSIHLLGRQVDEFSGEIGDEGLEAKSFVEIGEERVGIRQQDSLQPGPTRSHVDAHSNSFRRTLGGSTSCTGVGDIRERSP
jgi:hypothetical protein